MWKARKLDTYEIIDDKTNRVIAAGLDERQAQALCSKHNDEVSGTKWKSGREQDIEMR